MRVGCVLCHRHRVPFSAAPIVGARVCVSARARAVSSSRERIQSGDDDLKKEASAFMIVCARDTHSHT